MPDGEDVVRRLLVHIGCAKGGSTAIQKGLRINHRELASRGIVVPSHDLQPGSEIRGGHGPYFASHSRKGQASAIPDLSDLLHAEAERRGASTIVLSGENLAGTKGFERVFAGLGERFDVSVLMYVRRQDDWFASAWQQWGVKRGGSLMGWIAGNVGKMADWHAMLEPWAEALGDDRITVRVYDRDALVGGDAFLDFCDVLGEDPAGLTQPGRSNPSFGPSLSRLIEGRGYLFDGTRDASFFNSLQELAPGLLEADDGSDLFAADEANAIMRRYAESNERLRRRFLGGLRRPLFALRDPNAPRIRADDSAFELELLQVQIFNLYKIVDDLRRSFDVQARNDPIVPEMSAPTSAASPTGAFVLGLPPRIDSELAPTKQAFGKVGNTGNLAFSHAIHEHLGGDAAEIRSVDWSAPPDRVNGTGSVAVVPAANQLGPHTDFSKLAGRWSALDVGMVMIGLGAQGPDDSAIPDVSEGTLRWIRGIADRAPGRGPNIAVRGPHSLRVLERFGLADQAVVLGCPSLLLNPSPTLGREVADSMHAPERIAVVAGHYGWKRLWRLEASLAELVGEGRGSYVGQAPLEMVMLTRGEADHLPEEALRRCRDFVHPEMPLPRFVRWSRKHGSAFFDISDWLEHYRRFDLVVGTRIHGTLLALQAGVPALCIAHDVRTTEMCETMRIPFVPAGDVLDGVTRDQVAELVRERFDPDAFDANRLRLCASYVAFLRENTIEPVDWLVAMADAQGSDATGGSD